MLKKATASDSGGATAYRPGGARIDEHNFTDIVGAAVFSAEAGSSARRGRCTSPTTRTGPEWLTLRTGLFRSREHVVPLVGATMASEGVWVTYSKHAVKNAPRVSADQEHIFRDAEGGVAPSLRLGARRLLAGRSTSSYQRFAHCWSGRRPSGGRRGTRPCFTRPMPANSAEWQAWFVIAGALVAVGVLSASAALLTSGLLFGGVCLVGVFWPSSWRTAVLRARASITQVSRQRG